MINGSGSTGLPLRKRDRFRRVFDRGHVTHGSQTTPSPTRSNSRVPQPGQVSTSSQAVNPGASASNLLNEALQRLTPQEQETIRPFLPANTDDINSVLSVAHSAAVQKQQLCQNKRLTWVLHGRTVSLQDTADKVVLWLDKFKTVGDVAVNADPIHAGLPWAGIRLLLDAAVSESQQMADLLSGLDIALYMMYRLKSYSEYYFKLPSTMDTLSFREDLVRFYALILKFIGHAIEVFQKSTARRALETFLQPEEQRSFEVESDTLASRLERTAQSCCRELLLHGSNDGARLQADLVQISTDLKYLRNIKDSISYVRNKVDSANLSQLPIAKGAAFDSFEEQYGSQCLENTRVDLIDQIFRWVEDPNEPPIYWLNGIAGIGKSTIARTVVQRLQRIRKFVIASFFFKRGGGDRGNATRFFTTLARQLAQHVPAMRQPLMHALDAIPDLPGKSLSQQFERLILQPLSQVYSNHSGTIIIPVVVIDALDECQDERDITTILRLLARAKNLRIVVTSRPELPIRLEIERTAANIFRNAILHKLTETTIEHDLTIYLKHQFALIKADISNVYPHGSLPEQWPRDRDIRQLVELARPLFIFASTICRFVGDLDFDPKVRLRTVLQSADNVSHSKFDLTYQPILGHILKREDKQEQKQLITSFREIVGPIVLLFEPLSANALTRILEVTLSHVNTTLSRLHSVLNVPTDSNVPIRLFHLSFRDFLVDPQKQGSSELWIDERSMHEGLALRCLDLLSKSDYKLGQDLCAVKKPGTRRVAVDQDIVNACISMPMAYACRYWVLHLYHSGRAIRGRDKFHEFLLNHFLHWMEALAWLGRLSELAGHISLLRDCVDDTEIDSEIAKFLDDAKRFVLQNRYVVDLAPLQLYSSAIMFAPEQSVVRSRFSNKREEPLRIVLDSQQPSHWGAELQKLEGHASEVRALAFPSDVDSLLLASASTDRTVRIWNVSTGEEVQKLEGHTETVTAVALSSTEDGQILASASSDNTLRLWDLSVSEEIRRLEGHTNDINTLAFSPDMSAHLLASGSCDTTIRLWDLKNDKMRILHGHNGDVKALVFSPDGRLLASASSDQTVRLWDVRQNVEIERLEGYSGYTHIAAAPDFSPDGRLLAFATGRNIRLWSVLEGKETQILEAKYDTIAVAFMQDQKIASASTVGSICLWDLATGEEPQLLECHNGSVTSIVFSRHRQLLASSSSDRTIRLWDPSVSKALQQPKDHNTAVQCIALARRGHLLASAALHQAVKVQDLSNGAMLKIEDPHDEITTMAFSQDGRYLASGSLESVVRVWKMSTGKVQHLEGHTHMVQTVTFSKDGRLLASGSSDQTTRVWNLCNQQVHELQGHLDIVNAISFSPNGRLIASASWDLTIKIWNALKGGKELQTLRGHNNVINALAFSQDGKLIASASRDGTVKLWDLSKNNAFHIMLCQPNISFLSFAANETHLKTNVGYFNISQCRTRPQVHSAQTVCLQGCTGALFLDRGWIKHNNEDLLWLPPNYRRSCYAMVGNMLAIGHASGQVSCFESIQDPETCETQSTPGAAIVELQ